MLNRENAERAKNDYKKFLKKQMSTKEKTKRLISAEKARFGQPMVYKQGLIQNQNFRH